MCIGQRLGIRQLGIGHGDPIGVMLHSFHTLYELRVLIDLRHSRRYVRDGRPVRFHFRRICVGVGLRSIWAVAATPGRQDV